MPKFAKSTGFSLGTKKKKKKKSGTDPHSPNKPKSGKDPHKY